MEPKRRSGKNVADVAKAAGVRHFVYGSAGIGKQQTGIPSWDSKQHIEAHMQALELPLTILRPMAFMELMTDKQFYSAVSTWHVMPTLMGESRKVGWLCTEDLVIIAANVFADPDRFVGQDLCLTSNTQSIEQCRTIYRKVMGKNPPRFPMPTWMFERLGFVGRDLSTMWRWLRTAITDLKPDATYAIHPGAVSVEDWLRQQNR